MGTPRAGNDAPQRLVVLGMGKLGAGEFNLSSDVDLILAHTAGGETDGAVALDNQELFTRLGREGGCWSDCGSSCIAATSTSPLSTPCAKRSG